MANKIVAVTDPQVGDWADHRSRELDPCRVVRVEGEEIWLELRFSGTVIGPVPAENYTFTREKVETDGA